MAGARTLTRTGGPRIDNELHPLPPPPPSQPLVFLPSVFEGLFSPLLVAF